tara:strand:- start:11030 stop:11428 length:399 start_codon:yes stop_codon:yes gene_type:complete
MNSIDQLKQVRIALQAQLKAYTPYEGKNLNRYKNTPEIDALVAAWENNPPAFGFGGLTGGVCIDHTNVNLDRLRERLEEVKECIHSLDLFESSYIEEYEEVVNQIKSLVARRKEIENNVNGIPSYMYADLLK